MHYLSYSRRLDNQLHSSSLAVRADLASIILGSDRSLLDQTQRGSHGTFADGRPKVTIVISGLARKLPNIVRFRGSTLEFDVVADLDVLGSADTIRPTDGICGGSQDESNEKPEEGERNELDHHDCGVLSGDCVDQQSIVSRDSLSR